MTSQSQKIAVLGGTGAHGSGIALRLAHAGHYVFIGSRDAEKAARICTRLRGLDPGVRLEPADNRSAAGGAQVVILTVPYGAQQSILQDVREQLVGKILVDATVPLEPPGVTRVQLPEGGSAAATAQKMLGQQVRVVAAFQNVSAHHLRDVEHTVECDVLVCGDDAVARDVVIGLAADMGLRAWHAGPIANSVIVEALTSVLISLNKTPGAGVNITGLPANSDSQTTISRSASQPPSLEPTFGEELRLRAIPGIPEVRPGDDLCAEIVDGLQRCGERLRDGDVLVVAQKIVSKAEGRLVELATVQPSERALALAATADKDPRLVELILRESTEVLRCRLGVIVVEHRLGFVMANAGIDQSNVQQHGEGVALLLPLDPDASCAALRSDLLAATGADVAVLIIDSHGRAWRQGTVGVAIGAAGLPALLDLRGELDRNGRKLLTTEVGLADELAAAASLLMGQASEGRPVVLARGVPRLPGKGRAQDLVRPRKIDLFR